MGDRRVAQHARGCATLALTEVIPHSGCAARKMEPAEWFTARAARRSAARASRRVESRVGSGELASSMMSGISVQPRTTASQPSRLHPFDHALEGDDRLRREDAVDQFVHVMRLMSSRSVASGRR